MNSWTEQDGERLQKVLARAGLGSRRACERLIERGKISVNGVTIEHQGVRVTPTDEIRVDGKLVPRNTELVVLLLNKPKGMVTTMSDDGGRPCVGDLVADRPDRLFHVGRLDADTTGLLLLSNDGDLTNRLMHPSHEVRKTYRATVPGPVASSVGSALMKGVALADEPPAPIPDTFRVVTEHGARAIVEISLHSGRNRIVRRMLAAVGHPVEELTRTQLGPLHLGSLRPGQLRELTQAEVRDLYAASEQGATSTRVNK